MYPYMKVVRHVSESVGRFSMTVLSSRPGGR